MEVVKKNLVSIICGVIAILALVALYWPISGMYSALLAQVDARIQVSSSLDTLANTSRTLPQLSPDQTEAQPLQVFPTQPVIDAAQTAIGQVSQQAKAMTEYAVDLNKHTVLLDGELPKPNDQVSFNFANEYATTISNYSRWQQVLDSTAPPTPAEVQAAKDKLRDSINKLRLMYNNDGSVDPQSQADAQNQFELESAGIQPTMELQAAKDHRVYLLSPPAGSPFPIDPNIKISSRPTPEQICDAQIVVWMLDDVTAAIARANDLYSDPATPGGPPQHDILHSAVKAIEQIEAPVPVLASTGFDAQAGVTTPAPKVPAVSPSGRVCNGLYDVLRFKIHLVVDASKLAEVVKALEVGQFITVLNVQVGEVVDPAVAAANPLGGYRYGSKPVVRAEFECEELLMRQWTDAIFPDDRKNGLGQAALGQPTDNSNGQFGPGGPAYGGPPGMGGGPPGMYRPQ